MTLEEAWRQYRDRYPVYSQAAKVCRSLLEEIAADAGISARVESRAKDLGEFARKIMRKYADESDPWASVTDKAAARVIVTRPRDVDDFARAVGASPQIHIVSTEDTRGGEPGRLAYGGLHLQVQLTEVHDEGDPVECEVQIRTEAQHLWSVVSHRLLYKKTVELPAPLQRPLYRLVALVELFDEELERVMEQLPRVEGFEAAAFLDLAEKQYLHFVPVLDSDQQLSLQVVEILLPLLHSDPEIYAEQLRAFVSDHRDTLTTVLANYRTDDFSYLLFKQPELILIYEALCRVPNALQHRWVEAGLPATVLDSTAAVLGRPLPELV